MKKRTFACFAVLLGLYLGLHNGHLALYRDDPKNIIHTFPYHFSLYPHVDQAALEQGIPIVEGSQLYRLLEDYMS